MKNATMYVLVVLMVPVVAASLLWQILKTAWEIGETLFCQMEDWLNITK